MSLNNSNLTSGRLGYISKRYIVIHADYRLLIPSAGLDVLQDCQALLNHIASPSFCSIVPPGITPDLHRILVVGVSGGGYPARCAGMVAVTESTKPSPRYRVTGVLSLIGMGGDFLLDKWVHPSVSSGPPNRPLGPREAEESRRRLWPEVKGFYGSRAECSADWNRARFVAWYYWHTTATFLDDLTGEAGLGKRLGAMSYEERGRAVPRELRDAFPQLWLNEKGNGERFPPMMLVHGTKDPLVYVEESLMTARQVKRVELILVEGAGHSAEIGSYEDKTRVLAFVKRCM